MMPVLRSYVSITECDPYKMRGKNYLIMIDKCFTGYFSRDPTVFYFPVIAGKRSS